jgi:hypothetical protein
VPAAAWGRVASACGGGGGGFVGKSERAGGGLAAARGEGADEEEEDGPTVAWGRVFSLFCVACVRLDPGERRRCADKTWLLPKKSVFCGEALRNHVHLPKDTISIIIIFSSQITQSWTVSLLLKRMKRRTKLGT